MDLKKREKEILNQYGQLINKNVEQHRFMEWTNHHDMYDVGLIEVWNRNAEVNFSTLKKKKDKLIGSVIDFPPYKDKAIIYVGRGPSLNKSWEMLRDADDRFIIVSTNSSIRFLLERDIVPDYMTCIDGRQYKGFWTLRDLPEKAKDVIGLFSMGVDPQALDDWPGKYQVIPIGAFEEKTKRRIKRRFGPPVPSGGNAYNTSVAIFLLQSQAKIHLFAGNDLSFGEQHYADEATPKDKNAYFTTKNIYGETVRTEIPLWSYKTWLESALIQFWPDYVFYNCSEGVLGVDPSGELYSFLDHMPLDIAIERIKNAMDFEKKPFLEKSKKVYTDIYKSGDYHPHGGQKLWESIIENGQSFDKALDIACGVGHSVEIGREAGKEVYGVDIAELSDIWKERGIDKYCVTAPANNMPFKDNEFDYVTCFEMMEHIEKDLVDETLSEIHRVGSNLFVFTIHLSLEQYPMWGYYHLHCTVKDHQWWLDKLKKAGFVIDNIDLDKNISDVGIYARKGPL